MSKNSSKTNIVIVIIVLFTSWALFLSCSSVDYFNSTNNSNKIHPNMNQINLVTYNIKAIYDKEENQINNLMEFVRSEGFDFVLFQELFDESVRDEIIEKTNTDQFSTIISRVDYNSFPEFIFQDAGLFMMSRYPRIDLSEVEFGGEIKNSNGVIHMILEKEISKTNDFLANKSVLGSLFSINDSTQLFLFTTHVQAIGTREHKEFQLSQIKNFIGAAVEGIIASETTKSYKNLVVLLAGDFNSNAYSYDRYKRLNLLLGNPRDLHMEYHGSNKEYTFGFRSRKPSRRYDYIFSYDQIGEKELRQVKISSIGVKDVLDDSSNSISDHLALEATLLIN